MFEKENEIMLEFAKSIAPVFMKEVLDDEKTFPFNMDRPIDYQIKYIIHYAKELTREYFNNQIK